MSIFRKNYWCVRSIWPEQSEKPIILSRGYTPLILCTVFWNIFHRRAIPTLGSFRTHSRKLKKHSEVKYQSILYHLQMKGSLDVPIGKRSHEETEGFNEEENSRVHSRPRAGESEPQSMLTDRNLTGLIFISKINHKNRCFIPSTKNYFSGIQVE
jgi:hypothetical protein